MNIVAASGTAHEIRDGWERWIAVPSLSAGAMGRFRVVFGLLLIWAVLSDPPISQPLDLHRNYSPLADWPLVHAVAASPAACLALHVATLALGVLFVIGVWTRTAFAALVAAIFLGRLVLLQSRGTHDWDLPLLTLLALLVVPWGDGFSFDARRAGWRGPDRAGPVYGLAIWIPGFMLGLALAAAAYAKLATAGVAWITTGAVRFHFVEDAANAPLQLGLWVAAHPTAAVALSLAAVAVEAVFIGHAFIRSHSVRFAFGAAGLLLFAGLYAFQGVLWWAWLALFSAFLPWQTLDRRSATGAVRRLRAGHLLLIGMLAGQQVAASATATEIEPLISNYPMYSSTYASPAEFDRVHHRRLQRLFFEANGTDITPAVQDLPNAPELLFNAAQDVAVGRPPDEAALAAFCATYRARFQAGVPTVVVTADRTAFDWGRGTFTPRTRVTVARLTMPEACR